MTIRSASFTQSFFARPAEMPATQNEPGSSTGSSAALVFFNGGDNYSEFRKFVANRELFVKCVQEYHGLLDRILNFANRTGPMLSPPLTDNTLKLIRQNVELLKQKIAHPPAGPQPGLPLMYGAGKERFQELANLLEQVPLLSREGKQRYLARRMEVVQMLAPSLAVCSGGVISTLEEALASLKPQNMGTPGQARTAMSRFIRGAALAQVKRRHGNAPNNEVHRANAIYNRLAGERGLSPISDKYAELGAYLPSPEDIVNCEEDINLNMTPAQVTRTIAATYLDFVQGEMAGTGQSGEEPADLYTGIDMLQKKRLDDEFGHVNPYSLLLTRPGEDAPYLARHPDLVARDFMKTLETQGLVDAGQEVLLVKKRPWIYTNGRDGSAPNKRRKLDDSNQIERIQQWAGLYWKKAEDESTAEISAAELLALRPYEILKSLKDQNISVPKQAAIFQELAKHVFISRERDNITSISREWFKDFITFIQNAPFPVQQALNHSVTMLACAFGHPEVLRNMQQLQQLQAQVGSSQQSHGWRGKHFNMPAPTGELPITVAVSSGHQDVLDLLIKYGADVNSRDNQGMTPLLYACQHGRAEAVKSLIDAGADPDLPYSDGRPPVVVAAAKNHASIVKLLMDASEAANSFSNRFALISYAVRHRSEELMAVLKEKDTPLDVHDDRGLSPLSTAILRHDRHGAIFLLDHGATIDVQNIHGDTPLFFAAQQESSELVILLVARKANIDHVNVRGINALMWAASAGHTAPLKALIVAKEPDGPQAVQRYIDHRNNHRQTALMLANCKQDTQTLKLLIDANANLDLKDQHGRTALFYVVISGNTHAVELLLDARKKQHESTFKDYVNIPAQNGLTALMQAAITDNSRSAQLLIDAGADVDQQDGNGNTALALAAKGGKTAVMETLISSHAGINLQNSEEETPLIQATRAGHEAAACLLIESAADLHILDGAERTPLMYAAGRGSEIVTNRLLDSIEPEQRIDYMNAVDRYGMTALMHACARGHSEAAAALVAGGADFHVMDHAGDTAILLAVRQGHTEVIKALIKHINDIVIYTTNNKDEAPFILAAQLGHAEIINTFIDNVKDIDINMTNNAGLTALMAASSAGRFHVVDLLLGHPGTDIGAVDNNGLTALMHAATQEHDDPRLVEYLLQHDPDHHATDYENLDVFLHAVRKGNLSIARLLVERGFDLTRYENSDDGHTAMILAEQSGNAAMIEFIVEVFDLPKSHASSVAED
jgi:ankyrin repeat protein